RTQELPHSRFHERRTVPRPCGAGFAVKEATCRNTSLPCGPEVPGVSMPFPSLRLILIALVLAAASAAGGYALYQQMQQGPADQSTGVDLKPTPPEIRPEFALSG